MDGESVVYVESELENLRSRFGTLVAPPSFLFACDRGNPALVADLAPPGADDRELVVLGAAWLGKTRLIDNLEIDA